MYLTVGDAKFHIRFEYEQGMSKCHLTQLAPRIQGTNAISQCSKKDQFRRTVGRKVALSRAMSLLSLTRDMRRAIWEEFFKTARKF